MSRPLRILFLDHTARWSGGEVALFRTIVALNRAVVEPIVALAEEGPFEERLRAAGIETHVLPLGKAVREVRKDTLGGGALLRYAALPATLWRYVKTLAAFARERQIDILHCNSLKSDIYGAFAGRRAKIPVLWHVRDHIDPTYLPAPAVAVFRHLARRLPQAVIANSTSTLHSVFPGEKTGIIKAGVVYDGLSAEQLTAPLPPERTDWAHHPPRVGLLGRITPWKGQHVFLEAAAQVVQQGQEATFQIIGAPLFGEEAYEKKIREQAATLGERVQFLGFREDVLTVLSELDILVHASTLPEPFGQVVTEGMAVGLPIIASDGGGVREILETPEVGIRTPMGDSEALAAALVRLLQNPQEANTLGRKAYQQVRERFTAERTARNLERFYQELRICD